MQGQGWTAWVNSAKIMRVARPLLSCEAVAIRNAVGHISLYQMYVRELITGCFPRDVIAARDNPHRLNPLMLGK